MYQLSENENQAVIGGASTAAPAPTPRPTPPPLEVPHQFPVKQIAIGIIVLAVIIAAASFLLLNRGSSTVQTTTATTTVIPAKHSELASFSLTCVGGLSYSGKTNGASYYAEVSNGTLGNWSAGNGLSSLVSIPSCASYNGSVYCVGGSVLNNAFPVNLTQYATPTPSGSLTFSNSTPYPYKVKSTGCVAGAGRIYCVGGTISVFTNEIMNPVTINATYYAPIGSGGVGQWLKTTPYPSNALLVTCTYYNNSIYCMQGYTFGASPNISITNYGSVYRAQILANGSLSQWSYLNSYHSISSFSENENSSASPVQINISQSSCNAYAGYIYCVGGFAGTNYTNRAYYAKIMQGGLGPWQQTTSYPVNVSSNSCTISNSTIYCLGGIDSKHNYISLFDVYFANVSSSGISQWVAAEKLPVPLYGGKCFSN